MQGSTGQSWGGHSMVWPLKRVLVYPPVPPSEMVYLDEFWESFGYLRLLNHRQAVEEHAHFRQILTDAGVEVITGEIDNGMLQDAIFPYDPVYITDAGAVLCRMGKTLRDPEVDLAERAMADLGIPVIGRINPPGTLEGGDCLWLDEKTLAIGRGYRTNAWGIAQMAEIMGRQGVQVITVGLPHWHGPKECLHLLSLISMVDEDLAVVHLPLLDIEFVQRLRADGIELVEIPENEFVTQATNVLVTSPRNCIILKENPVTAARLEDAGCTVTTYTGGEISHNRTGGPTCLTRPLLRERP